MYLSNRTRGKNRNFVNHKGGGNNFLLSRASLISSHLVWNLTFYLFVLNGIKAKKNRAFVKTKVSPVEMNVLKCTFHLFLTMRSHVVAKSFFFTFIEVLCCFLLCVHLFTVCAIFPSHSAFMESGREILFACRPFNRRATVNHWDKMFSALEARHLEGNFGQELWLTVLGLILLELDLLDHGRATPITADWPTGCGLTGYR